MFRKPGIWCFFEEEGLSMTSAWIILIGGLTDLCIGMKKALAIGILSYFQSLLTLKTWWERKYEIDIFQESPVITIVSAWMNDKKSFTKAIERLANHFLYHTDTCTPIRWDYPEEGLGLKAVVGLGNLRADSSALRTKLRWASYSRHNTPSPSPFQTIIWAVFGTVKSSVSVSNSNCRQRHEYLPVTISLGYEKFCKAHRAKRHKMDITLQWQVESRDSENSSVHSDWNRVV